MILINLKTGTIIEFDEVFLIEFLDRQTGPVMESVILNALTLHHKLDHFRNDIYNMHFSLFNALYRLKYITGAEGYFLNIDTMRLRLIRVPRGGCLFYDSEKGTYCGDKTVKNNFCSAHAEITRFDEASFDLMREFYMNPENISYNEDEIFRKIYKGYLRYSLNTQKVNEALDFFKIGKNEISKLKKIYHELAKKYHPDVFPDSGEMMKKINRHYQVLSEIIP